MGFLDWMKRRDQRHEPEPEPEYGPPAPYGSTQRGKPIDLAGSTEWRSDPVGVHESRLHLGKSIEGFHGGFQVVPAGGDGAIQWSNARPTRERAFLAAERMSERWEKENAQFFLDVENNAIRSFQGAPDAKPVEAAEPKPSRTQSIFSDYPDRILKTEADVRKDDALLDMTLVVNEIANDPDTNWRKYKGEFEKAVKGMRDAFEPAMRPQETTKTELRNPDSAQVHFWRSAWEPKGYVGAIDAEVGNTQDALERAFSAFNGQDDHVVYHGPSASVGDTFIYESTLGRGTQLSVYRIERSGYERLPAGEFSGELKGWLEKSFGAAAKQEEPPVHPTWVSGKIEASGYDRDLGAHVSESVRGVVGESAEGFHYRLDRTDSRGEAAHDIQSYWSGPQPTRQAALASLKKDLVVEARKFSEQYEMGKGGTFARVSDAMRNGYVADGAGQVDVRIARGERKHPGAKVTELQDYNKKQSLDASSEHASRPVDRSRSWDR